MSNAWSHVFPTKVKRSLKNVFLFYFDQVHEVEWVVDEQPWKINGNLLALKRVVQVMNVREVVFDAIPMWVQLYDLPYNYAVKKKIRSIACMIEDVLLASLSNRNASFGRVRVMMIKLGNPVLPWW